MFYPSLNSLMKKSARSAVQERLSGSVVAGGNAMCANTHSESRREERNQHRRFTVATCWIEARTVA